MKEARAFKEDSRSRGTNSIRYSETKTVDDAVDRWLRICEKEGTDGNEPVTQFTLKTYGRRAEIIKSYNWSKPLNEIKTPDVVDFRSWLLRNFSQYLAHKSLSSFHSVMKEMALRGIIATNIVSGVSVKSKSRYDEEIQIPTCNEIELLLQTADALAASRNLRTAKMWARYRPILYLAVDSGMRPQEYLAVGVQHLKSNGVEVERAIEKGGYRLSVTKTRAGRRFIELSDRTLQILSEHIECNYQENPHGLLFPTDTGKWMQIEHWRNRGFYSLCETAQLGETVTRDGGQTFIPKYTPYSLRHFYASMLIYQKENLKKIQRLLGHEKIETTFNSYGHLIDRVEDSSLNRSGLIDRIGASDNLS